MYDVTIYKNFKDLQEHKPDVAKSMLNDLEAGEWQNYELCFYDTCADFAKYEVNEGWYAALSFPTDYNGAPDLLDYIDYEALASDLVCTWDDSVNWCDEELDIVVTTTVGW